MSRRSFLVGSGTLAGSALLLAGGAYVAGDARLDHPLRDDCDRTRPPPGPTSTTAGPRWSSGVRSDGYGIVHVDHEDEAVRIECWP